MLQEKITETLLIDGSGGDVPLALIFPNEYSVAVANLGFNSAYFALVKAGFSCERFVYSGGQLKSISGRSNISNFRIWAFSLSFEMDLLNVFEILSKTGVKALSEERKGNPVILFGGAMTFFNPNSFWYIADIIFHGEVEGDQRVLELIHDAMKAHVKWSDLLSLLNEFDDLSIPLLGEKNVRLSKIKDLSKSFGESFMLSNEGAFGKAYLLEIERGCIHSCAFCVASKIYAIVRFMPLDEIERRVLYALRYTDRVGLVGSSVSDYPQLYELLEWLKGKVKHLSVSSLRLDTITTELVETLNLLGDREITLAPEAGTQRMRDLLNKDISDEEIDIALEQVKAAGLKRIKMYFIYGLPDEDIEDLDGIVEVTDRAKRYGIIPYISLNPLIPKPFTSFENFRMRSQDDLKKSERYLQKKLGKMGIRSKFESIRLSRMQWIISTADKEMSKDIALSDDRIEFLKRLDKEWEGKITWKYISNSWKNSVFGDNFKGGIIDVEKKNIDRR